MHFRGLALTTEPNTLSWMFLVNKNGKWILFFFYFPKKSEMATLAVGSQQPLCSQYKAEEKFRNLQIL